MHICFSQLLLQNLLMLSDLSLSYSPQLEQKTCFPAKSSPPFAIQLVLAADPYSGPSTISTFAFIFHACSINKAHANKTFSQMRPKAPLSRYDARPQLSPSGKAAQLHHRPAQLHHLPAQLTHPPGSSNTSSSSQLRLVRGSPLG